MISTRKNFIFVHIPKTGGNSIQNNLKIYADDEIVIMSPYQDGVNRFEVRNRKYSFHKHSTLQDYKNELDPLFFKKALAIYNASCYNEVRNMFSEKTGRKTLSFWENLMLIGDRTTIDVHMIRHLGIKGSLTDKKYREAEKVIQDYAKEINIKPYDLQAIIWTTVRGKAW